jgi:hypothetical protein
MKNQPSQNNTPSEGLGLAPAGHHKESTVTKQHAK